MPFLLLLVFCLVCRHASTYQCTPTNCKMPKCHCASTDIPGNIPAALAPQFITLSFDDNMTPSCLESFQKPLLCPNISTCGSRYRATLFTTTSGQFWSDFYTVHQLYSWGNEIADHTMIHSYPWATGSTPAMTEYDWYNASEGAREYIRALGMIPDVNITGFRTPYLFPSAATYQALQQVGSLVYESGMQDEWLFLSGPGKYIYPFTLDYGSPLQCADSTYDPSLCTMSIPGMWEIPLYPIRDLTSPQHTALTTMDIYGYDLASKMFYLKENFWDHYTGNRAPFHIPLHCLYSASAENLVLLNEFYDWASTLPNVFFVTYSQIIHWMQNPVPAYMVPSQKYMTIKTPTYGTETCDGFDNNNNGLVDEGLLSNCSYPQTSSGSQAPLSFLICATCCPPLVPLASDWVPNYNFSCPGQNSSKP